MQPQSKDLKTEFLLWPNGMLCKSFIFPILIIAATLTLQVYLGRFPLNFLLSFILFLGGPIGLFMVSHRIIVAKTEIQGPMIGSVWSKAKISRRDAHFDLGQKILGLPVFIIRDKRTNAEINSFRLYFSKRSLERLKELVVSK